jgi:outer membrane receptor protein involved in Fe transport
MVGLQVRHDRIDPVGLHHTRERVRLSTTREDRVLQTSLAPYGQTAVRWSPWLRTTLGLRGDLYWFDVASNLAENSGNAHASLLSPKLSLVLGPWRQNAVFMSVGSGFHSNDARGATIRIDPASGNPTPRVDPLVRTRGAEIGVRSRIHPRLETSVTVWGLEQDTELLFVGDAGTTEASRPSRRTGLEWTTFWAVRSWASADLSAAFSRGRFTDEDPAGERIPGAVGAVLSGGLTVTDLGGFFGNVRLRHLGPRPLIEDNSVRTKSSTILHAQVGRRLWSRVSLAVEGFNLLDAEASDIDYFYTSRLAGEPVEGIADIHTHPEPPRLFRVRLTASLPVREGVPRQTGHPQETRGAP